jgi:predicted NBD/HSP70 family sugar kinase
VATSAALRQINLARVLSTLRRGSWSRVALAEELGLNRSTVTVIVSALLGRGLVTELDPEPHGVKNGRPRVGIALRGGGAYFGGLEIGNDQLTAVVSDLTGVVVARASEPTQPERGPLHAERRLAELLRGVVGDRTLEGIGFTVPGLVTTAGRLEWAPTLGWRNVTLGDTVRSTFGVPVYVENDANAAAVAEEQFRDPTEGDSLLYVLLDSGLGAGLMIDRELYRGGGGRFGEAGHIRLPGSERGASSGTVEHVLGRSAVLEEYRLSAGGHATYEDLLLAVEGGESAALQLRDRWQGVLGWLAAALAWTLDPDVIVFGGPMSALLQSDSSALAQSLYDNGPSGTTEIWRLSSLGPDSAALGAVALSLRAYFAIPPLLLPARSRQSLEEAS